jgi:hypothetical protein
MLRAMRDRKPLDFAGARDGGGCMNQVIEVDAA